MEETRKPNVTTFRDGSSYNIVFENGASGLDDAEIAKFFANLFWGYLKNHDGDINVNAHKKGDDFAVTLNNSTPELEKVIAKAASVTRYNDVKEAVPVKEEKPETAEDLRFQKGRYKGMTPKEAVAKDSYKALRYLQKSIVFSEGGVPEAMEKEIRKQCRASAHKTLGNVRDVDAFLDKKDSCDYVIEEYLLILPEEKVLELAKAPKGGTLKTVAVALSKANDKAKRAFAKRIVTEFLNGNRKKGGQA